ncbi:hypothetical protein [Agriterribacter sp.]|uniref:hypothetical protein n=1 Tax=Agriterribacter sp. TaxID=2821509 RepID=UPI002D12C5BF|nr:hypothetical protein [Agriterribacter sp.]HTN06003.1 hypothetical protein [Agriterribacter sp.]
MRLNAKILLVLLVAGITGAASCTKDKLKHEVLDPEQLVSGRLAGTWAHPSNIVTPDNVPPEVFGGMRLVFTTDASGNPSQFLAQDCPIVFGNAGAGAWTVTGTQDSAMVNVTGVDPLDEFSVKVTTSTLTLSFYMGWENTDTKATGQGNFKVTLARQ